MQMRGEILEGFWSTTAFCFDLSGGFAGACLIIIVYIIMF